MFRVVIWIGLAALLATPAVGLKPSCRANGDTGRTLECLVDRLEGLESELRRAIVLFERHHCPEGWIKLEDSRVREIGGTFRNTDLPLVYCKRLDL